MKSAGAAEGAADLITADGFSDVMNDNQSGVGSIAQTEQRLAERGHGTRIVFVLIVGGVQRVENDHVGFGGTDRRQEVIQAPRCAEQMAGGFGVDEEIGIGSRTDRFAHRRQARGELRSRQLKLADENASRCGNLETAA